MLNASSAVAYNRAAGFPAYLVNAILSAVGGPPANDWTPAGVAAVAAWQQARGLADDGKVGPKTIGKLLDAMLAGLRLVDAAALKLFWEYKKASKPAAPATAPPAAPATAPSDPDGVVKYFHHSVPHPFRFRRLRDTHPATGQMCDWWTADGTFQVDVRLDPKLGADELWRYEYRQFIAGRVLIQDGSWDAARSRWTPGPGPVRDGGKAFRIPPAPLAGLPAGLTPQMKPDGLVSDANETFRFGRRSTRLRGDTFRSLWAPTEGGPNYSLRDSPGYLEPYTPGAAPKVQMWLEFRGEVVEVDDPDADEASKRVVRVLAAKTWRHTLYDVLKWWEARPR